MSFLSQARAQEQLAPFFPDFDHIMRAAWQDWLRSDIAPQMQHKRVRAAVVWNNMITQARRRFVGRKGIRFGKLRDQDGLMVGESTFIRLKMGNRDLLSRNYPTPEAVAFHDQTQDFFGGVARLELLYVLDKAELNVERVVLVQRHKAAVVWAIEVIGNGGMSQGVIPFAPDAPSGPPAERMIKPKEKQVRVNKRQSKSNGEAS